MIAAKLLIFDGKEDEFLPQKHLFKILLDNILQYLSTPAVLRKSPRII